jgi:hypothetical protein
VGLVRGGLGGGDAFMVTLEWNVLYVRLFGESMGVVLLDGVCV